MNFIKRLIPGFLFVCGCCISAYAQEEGTPWYAPDTIKKISAAGIGDYYVYDFDERGNALVIEYVSVSKRGKVTPIQKIVSHYNRLDLVDTTINYRADDNGGYKESARKISAYDSKGNHISLINENSDGAGGWIIANRYTFSYNAQNLRTLELVEVPDGETWVNSTKAEYAYDEQGNQTTYEYYRWDGSAWAPSVGTYSRYENGLLVERSGKNLNAAGNFVDAYRYKNTYNAEGKLLEWFYEVFEYGSWENAYRRLYQRDEKGYDTVLLSYEWYLNKWDLATKEIYTNDADGKRLKVDHYQLDDAGEEMYLSVVMEYEYNETGRRKAYTFNDYRDEGGEYLYEYELNEYNDDVRATCYVKKGEEWQPTNRYNLEVQYHDGTSILYANSAAHEITVHYRSGIRMPYPNDVANQTWQTEADFSLRVWPVPARDILSVEAEENGRFDISLYDLSGRLLDSRRAVQHAEFNVADYHGMYLLRVEKDGAVVARKVVIL